MKKLEELLSSSKRINLIVTISIIVVALIITVIVGIDIKSFSEYEPYFYEGNATEIQKLSEYSPRIEGTAGDCDIYVIKGPDALNKDPKDCPSILLLGGTHPNEPAGQIAAVTILENLVVHDDTIVYVIVEANRSAYTHSHPQEASPFYYTLETKSGALRTFKFGSRATNTNEQWPNPDVYTHPSGQQLSTNDTRNLNRAYPGKIDGTYTEQIAYGITELIRQNDIKITIDFHEASPEYNNINSIVYHNYANKIASDAFMELDFAGIGVAINASPETLHGLTHRELGDHTNTFAFLCETSNAAQGKIRGKFTKDLITYYEPDKFYEAAKEVTEAWKKGEEGALQLLYGYATTIDERVARHVATSVAIVGAYNMSIDKSGSSFEHSSQERIDHLLDCGKLNFELNLDNELIGVGTEANSQLEDLYYLFIDEGVGYFLHDPE